VRNRRRLTLLVAAVLVVAGAAIVLHDPGERTTVTFDDEDGSTLATANVAVSDTFPERYTGLSDTESLGPNEGMLFVHPQEDTHTYVMRDMAFPIDIVFVAANGTITTVHHAELPAEGEDLEGYRGYGKFVVELPYEFTDDHGIEEGDTVEIPDEHRKAEG
jgi:uncharacterized membrane protein (UPF0127 family)